MKLGEMLVREGKITPAELEETLKGQAIFGGRFGTNLVEMGFLDEQELTQFLSQKTGVPFATSEQLMNITPQVIKLLPEEAVKKYRVVPVALNNRKLFLAMTDPSDFATIDEISFVTGYVVVPLITPELRLICALEKYYNIKRALRYIPVAGGGRSRGRVSPTPPSPAPPQQAVVSSPLPVEPDDSDIFELPMLDELDCFCDLDETKTLAPSHPPVAAGMNRALAPPPTLAGEVPQQEAEKLYSMEDVLQGLANAPDRQDIADMVVGYAGRQFKKAALFMIKGKLATGWMAQVGAQRLSNFDTLEIGLDEPSVLKLVADSKTFYLGPMPISPCNSRICAALGGEPSSNQFLAPLIMMGRVVTVLYVDGGTRQLDDSIPELQKLLSKMSMAFEILILRSKILLT